MSINRIRQYLQASMYDSIYEYAKRLGVEIQLDARYSDNEVYIISVHRNIDSKPGSGAGVIRHLLIAAKRDKKNVLCSIPIANKKLFAYFSKLGFIEQSRGNGEILMEKPYDK